MNSNLTSIPIQGRSLDLGSREQLLQRIKHLLARVEALKEIGQAINRCQDLDEIFQVVGQLAKSLLYFEHLSVYANPKDSGRLVTLFGPELELDEAAIATGIIGRALKSGQPLLSEESGAKLGFYPCAIVIPIENSEGAIGTVNFATTQESAYAPEDLHICSLLGWQLSSAIRHTETLAELKRLHTQLEREKQQSEELLLNMMPEKAVAEFQKTGEVKPGYYESATVVFTDFKHFTKSTKNFTPEELVSELNYCFSYFDKISEKYNLEKVNTIGDSYMCVAGVPVFNPTHAIDAVLAGMEMQIFMYLRKAHKLKNNIPYWDIRIGIDSGSLIGGVIGKKNLTYDLWGETVNNASRIKSAGLPGKIQLSNSTFNLVKDFFDCEFLPGRQDRQKRKIDIYLVNGIKEGLSIDPGGILPNDDFIEFYLNLHSETDIIPPFCKWKSN